MRVCSHHLLLSCSENPHNRLSTLVRVCMSFLWARCLFISHGGIVLHPITFPGVSEPSCVVHGWMNACVYCVRDGIHATRLSQRSSNHQVMSHPIDKGLYHRFLRHPYQDSGQGLEIGWCLGYPRFTPAWHRRQHPQFSTTKGGC